MKQQATEATTLEAGHETRTLKTSSDITQTRITRPSCSPQGGFSKESELSEKEEKRKPSGWFDFKGADAAWDDWLAKRGLKCPLKPLGDALTKADREWDQMDRDWGLKK